MHDLLLAFLTGLTTGGLSCMAVQGGLLATSFANQVELEVQHAARHPKQKQHQRPRVAVPPLSWSQRITDMILKPRSDVAVPIGLFLGAKVVAYTLLGFLLGWLGSMVQLNVMMRAVLQLGVGLFMVGMALNLLNVHPIFRYFMIQPPRPLMRVIRRIAKHQSFDMATPIVLGAFTVFIPCGVTQAMMALAIASGNPLTGAGLLGAFVLGTTPIFFTLAYFATQLGKSFEKHFLTITAIVVLALGLISVNSGLTLFGSPFSLSAMTAALTSGDSAKSVTTASSSDGSVQTIALQITDQGYSPSHIQAKAGQAVVMTLNTANTQGCIRAFVVPSLGMQQLLPTTGTTTVTIPAQVAGKTVRFTCSMGMYNGQIDFT